MGLRKDNCIDYFSVFCQIFLNQLVLNLGRMLEQDADRQNFRPYGQTGYIPLEELTSNSDSTNQFRRSVENKLYSNAMSKIVHSVQEILGKQVYAIDGDALIPRSWQTIESYLQEHGLAERFALLPPFNDYPKLFHAYLRMTPAVQELTDGLFHRENMSSNATSTDIDTALSRTAGEFLERYSLSLHRKKDLLRMSYARALKAGCISLDTYCANMRVEISGEQEFLWVRGHRIDRTGSVLLPAQLVYWNYDNRHADWREPVISESNTNGAGAGPSLEAAILAGVYELIERDGFLIYWLNSISPSVIEPDSISMPELRGLIDDCKRYGLKVYFLNTMSDISIPTCTAVMVDDSGIGPKVAIGACSASEWEAAMIGALGEALSVAYGLRGRQPKGEDFAYFTESDSTLKIARRQRLSIWGNSRMFKHFEFFLAGSRINLSNLRHFERHFGTKKEELHEASKAVRDADNSYDIYYYSVKDPVLRELGFNSVKVIIPQLVPLYLREIFLPAGAERLRNVPPKLGRTASPILNKFPHPFP